MRRGRRPELPTAEEIEEMRAAAVDGLMSMVEGVGPVFDAGDGMRADLEKRGWSPAAAEQIAMSWVIGALGAAFSGVTRDA